MTAYEKFYRESLYPFQDGILAIVRRIDVPFYLTGGTALSRHYSPVRYSDDLDLFVNRAPEFSPWVERFYAALENESSRGLFSILTDRVLRFEDYVQIFLQQPAADEAVTLKLDLVNDVAPRYGDLEWAEALGRVDSWRNILSNKVSALYRIEAKDVVDVWTVAKIRRFNWAEIIREASSKEAGLDPLVLYDLLKSFPAEALSSIKWVEPKPDETLFMADLQVMAAELFEGLDNTLAVDR
jgi:hypothetical protein